MKNFLCLFLAVMLVLGLCACMGGNLQPTQPTEPDLPTEPMGGNTRQELENALMETAWAYYMKGNKMQYCSEELTLGLNKYTGGNYRLTEDAAPEFGTTDTTIYSVCSDFVYKMYYEALGHRLFDAENYLGATTSDFWLKSEDVALLRWFNPKYELKEIDTKYGVTMDKAMSTQEVISFLGSWRQTLRPGDVLVITGHAMVYVGNGYVLDCWGTKYDTVLGLEREEYSGAVHFLHKIEDVFIQGDDPISGNGYKISDSSSKNNFVVFRPLDAFVSEKGESADKDVIDIAALSEDESKYTSTLGRIQYPAMEIDRTADAGPYGSVATGGVLTYNIKVSNFSNEENYVLYRRAKVKGYEGEHYKSLVITETIPRGTELLESSITGGGVYKDGVITWTVDIDAGSSAALSYSVKVTAKRGDAIVNDGGKVATIASNKLVNTVSGGALSDTALQGLLALASTKTADWREQYNISKLGTDLEFAERVYQSAMNIGLELPAVQEILDNLFAYQTVENASCSDRYPDTMRAKLYVLKDNVDSKWQTVADMLVDGYCGGKKLYSADRSTSINEFKVSYLQPGDILVYASVADLDGKVSASRIMVYAGKNSEGNVVLLSLNTDQIFRVLVGSTNNNADELHTMLWNALTEDIFFVLRPVQAYDNIHSLAYDQTKAPTYGSEPADKKEGLQIGNGYSTAMDAEYISKLAGLTANGWSGNDVNFVREVYQAIGLDISSAIQGTTIGGMLGGDVFFQSVGSSQNRNYELRAVVSPKMERPAATVVPGLWGGPDMVGYTSNIISLKDLQPGDVINLFQLQRGITWVGVYLGDGKLLVSKCATNAPSGKYQEYQVYDFSSDKDGSAFTAFLTKDGKDGIRWNCYFVTRPAWGLENINKFLYAGDSTISYIPGLEGFTQVSSMEDIKDGHYVIVVKYNNQYYFMTNEADLSRVQFGASTATVSNGVITADNLQYWCIDVNTYRGDVYDVYISSGAGYLYQKTQDAASLDVTGSTGTEGASWALSFENGHFILKNNGVGARMLMLSTQHGCFKAYGARNDVRYPEILLFKYTGDEGNGDAAPVIPDGAYNIVVKYTDGKYYAMTDTFDDTNWCIAAEEVSVNDGVIGNATVWTITNDGEGNVTLMSPGGVYLIREDGKSNILIGEVAEKWLVAKDETTGVYTLQHTNSDTRYLAYNGTGFKAYAAANDVRVIELLIVPVP